MSLNNIQTSLYILHTVVHVVRNILRICVYSRAQYGSYSLIRSVGYRKSLRL